MSFRSLFLASCLHLLCALAAWAQTPAVPVAETFDRQIAPLLKAHCFGCHGVDKQEGGVSYAELLDGRSALRRRPLWKRALARVQAQEMPPAEEEPLAEKDQHALVAWLKQASEYVDCSEQGRDPGPTVIRRLTRKEYDRTIRDLLGVEIRSAEAVGMPDEGVAEGFDNTSAALGFSPALLEKYLAAADQVLDLLFSSRYRKQREALIFARPQGEDAADAAAREIAQRFARRAYRGPVSDADMEPLLAIFRKANARGADFDESVKAMLKPVLVAPRFLFRLEAGANSSAEASSATPITDHEFAVRLSYFLWSSMPDAELSDLADRGELSQASVRRAQVLRMLQAPQARAWVDDFALQWLQLKKLDQARPQREFFPTFTNELRQAMREETVQFLDHLRREDRSVLELLDSDYTYVNAPLAKHYGLPAPAGKEFERVALRPADHRGGLLGMGSILAMTSHTFRTSPTLRGKYVLEVMLGVPVPPPPPDAGMLKEDQRDKRRAAATFREQLAQHASRNSCRGCHKKLDPLGFALDNYDPIGAWRESQPELALDVVGELPGGERFAGAAELKQLLLKRKDEFVKNLAGKCLSYALGRELDYYDDCAILEISERLMREEYRLSELVLGVVESYPFQHRRREPQ
jgi:hypothetical protein